ncbi:MAG: biotin/lipoyl-binding protein [Aquificae bacterium]|nr:biotin/lipoyl-binding protein [Aquificota bacterium]
MSKIKFLIALIIIVLLIVGGVKLVKKRQQELAKEKTPQRPVYVVDAVYPKKGEIEQTSSFLGFLKPLNVITVFSKKPAYIQKIYVEVGQTVKKGQLLVQLDNKDIKSQIETLQMDIQNTKLQIEGLLEKKKALEEDLKVKQNTYKRDLKLLEKKAVPEEKVERSLTMVKLAEANLQQLEANIKQLENNIKKLEEKISFLQNELSYFQIKSSTYGTIQNIFQREGNLAIIGKPVLSIESSSYELNIPVPETFHLDKNTNAYIHFDNQKLPLVLDGFYPSSQKNLKILRGIVHRKPKELKSNSYIKVTISKKIRGTKLPINAILTLTNGNFVLVYKDGVFQKIPVHIISQNREFVIIKEELDKLPVAIADESKLRLLATGQKAKIALKE